MRDIAARAATRWNLIDLAVIHRFGRLDVVVVNAGVARMGLVDAVPVEDLDLQLDVNVRGVFLAIQAALPHMKDGGRIVTIGSNIAQRSGFDSYASFARAIRRHRGRSPEEMRGTS